MQDSTAPAGFLFISFSSSRQEVQGEVREREVGETACTAPPLGRRLFDMVLPRGAVASKPGCWAH